LASASVVNGSTIQVQAGTYPLATTLTISKEVQIYGVDKSTTIFTTAGTSTDPVRAVSVGVNNVVIKGVTIKQRKTSNISIESALTVSGPASTRVSNFIMDDCRIEHMEFGLVIRGENWKVANSDFVYVGPTNSTRRHLGIYGFLGNCYALSNTSNEVLPVGATGNTRWFNILSSTGTNPAETNVGTLVIEGNTQAGGNLQQFFNQENWQGSAASYTLVVKGNTTLNESSAFVALFGAAANFGNILAEVQVSGNTLSNVHGKGVMGIDAGGLVAFRSSSLTFHAPPASTLLSYQVVPAVIPYVAAPASSSASGSEGDVASDATYFYSYTGGRWQRIAWDTTVW
jgi:hypothetical protein